MFQDLVWRSQSVKSSSESEKGSVRTSRHERPVKFRSAAHKIFLMKPEKVSETFTGFGGCLLLCSLCCVSANPPSAALWLILPLTFCPQTLMRPSHVGLLSRQNADRESGLLIQNHRFLQTNSKILWKDSEWRREELLEPQTGPAPYRCP